MVGTILTPEPRPGRVEEVGRQVGYSMRQTRSAGQGVASAVLAGIVQEGQSAPLALSLLVGNATANACSGVPYTVTVTLLLLYLRTLFPC